MHRNECFIKHSLIALGIAVILFWVTVPSYAHWADLAVADINVGQKKVTLILTFPTGLMGFADTNRDGQISPNEITEHYPELIKFISEKIRLEDNRSQGILQVAPVNQILPQGVNISEKSHSSLKLSYSFAEPMHSLTMRYDLFLPEISSASLLATIYYNGQTQSVVFTPEKRSFPLITQSFVEQAFSFTLLGIEHILSGYDHILFLIGLLMFSGVTLSYLAKVVTAFTVAHSVTLTLAVLNIVSLPSQWVESAIALTIVYVAAENFWKKEPGKRWLLTFGFGLIHGLGFASVLKEIGLPHSNVAISLASFNIGVEIGQLAIVSLVFAALQVCKRFPQEAKLRWAVSAGAVIIGLAWFVDRAFRIGFMPF